MTPILITATAMALLAAGSPALAANLQTNHPHHAMKDVIIHPPTSSHGPHVASTHLQYEEEDVSSPQAATALLGRIRVAAKKVCAPAPHGKVSMQENADYKQCLKDGTEEAVRGVNSSYLTAAYKAG